MKRVVFLDRDGTINVDRGYVSRREDWEFLPGAVQGMRTLARLGFHLAVVSNQSGVARGLYGADYVDALHTRVAHELFAWGIEVVAWAYCPHGPDDGCGCRKPRTGLVGLVERRLGAAIDYAGSWTIGDKLSDIEFGQTLGTRTILLRSRYWIPADLVSAPTVILNSLGDAAEYIANEAGNQP